jgi:hypothetical protein
MPGSFSITTPIERPFHSDSSVLSTIFLLLLLSTSTLSFGCSPNVEGSLDIDAIRKKSISEGKADPIPDSPTTPEARKARAERLRKEALEKTSKRP